MLTPYFRARRRDYAGRDRWPIVDRARVFGSSGDLGIRRDGTMPRTSRLKPTRGEKTENLSWIGRRIAFLRHAMEGFRRPECQVGTRRCW